MGSCFRRPVCSLAVFRDCNLMFLAVIRVLGTLDRSGVLLVPKTMSKYVGPVI